MPLIVINRSDGEERLNELKACDILFIGIRGVVKKRVYGSK